MLQLAIFNLLAASAIPMRPSAQAFAADSCSDLLVFLLDMNNAPFVIDSVFISLSLIKGAYHFLGWSMWFFHGRILQQAHVSRDRYSHKHPNSSHRIPVGHRVPKA